MILLTFKDNYLHITHTYTHTVKVYYINAIIFSLASYITLTFLTDFKDKVGGCIIISQTRFNIVAKTFMEI